MNKYYVIMSSVKDEKKPVKYIGIDQSSGGYPYEVDSPFHGKVWHEYQIDEMLNYFKMFHGSYHGRVWEICEIDFVLKPQNIKMVTETVSKLVLG
jgi:hypothetical protein